MCMTKQHELSNYNHGEYELLIKMDKTLELKKLEELEADEVSKPHHFYFTIENPSDENVTFAFKVRNFVNITETMNTTIYEYGPDPNQCVEEEVEEEEVIEEEEENNEEEEETDIEPSGTDTEINEVVTEKPPVPVTEKPPCIRETTLLNETYLEWYEEYPIPEVFYITYNYTIEPHSSLKINVSLTFKPNPNVTQGGYLVISEDTGESEQPFYWEEVNGKNSGKLPKLTNMEIILESDLPVGLSSYSLMTRRELEEESFLGKKCSYDENKEVLNGVCGDGYYCKQNQTCEKCDKKICKECDDNKKCTKCFAISVDGQWNPPGGKGNDLNCELDYIDVTKVKINGAKAIEVPPAIHWRVTMDFWVWISDPTVLRDSKTNMNIVYKDFIAITLKCTQEGLKVFATPMEFLYEYPTLDEDDATKETDNYKENVANKKDIDIVTFLTETVRSYGKVTMEDLILNAESNWKYIRFGFNLDSSKEYLNDLPERNLIVTQIYTTQTEMPFHMKKFYGTHNMTKLYFQNFYHPLSEELEEAKKNITIYLRNLNIFREYIPQNIITKYYNLYTITSALIFPQLMVSFPFSHVTYEATDKFKMKGYNYYVRQENTGIVIEQTDKCPEVTEYLLELDPEVTSLRPPRNFWRLNLLDLNEQPKTCDFEEMIDLACDSPMDLCFDKNKPFACEDGDTDRPYYLDIFELTCNKYCPIGYMHPPRYSTEKKRLYCSHLCDTGKKQCPSDDYKYTEIHTNFLCTNDFFNLYYKCFNKDESINNADFSGIFFSSFLWTPTIYIPLGKDYTEFSIDFWYFPDDRFRYLRYPDPQEIKNKNYPLTHKNPPSEINRIIFLSDCIKVTYGDVKNNEVLFYKANSRRTATNNENIADNNWNHFVFTYFKSLTEGWTYYLTFKINNIFIMEIIGLKI